MRRRREAGSTPEWPWTSRILGWAPSAGGGSAWEPGEAGAQVRLQQFLERRLEGYESSRDFPGVEGTSRLSPHLHFGEIGPRQVWQAVEMAEHGGGRRAAAVWSGAAAGVGGEAFLRQLGWREFAHYLLFHFPWTAEEPFDPEFTGFPWADDPAALDAWRRGRPGIRWSTPGCSSFLAEGWIAEPGAHGGGNYLTKDLLVPWRDGAGLVLGSAWWMRNLANNTLGWQWSAGSGPDAAPYFRVFNPVLQARRFDADSECVGRWKAALEAGRERNAPVPLPIVEHRRGAGSGPGGFQGLHSSGGDAGNAAKTSCQAIYKYETFYALPAIYREEGDCWTNRMALSSESPAEDQPPPQSIPGALPRRGSAAGFDAPPQSRSAVGAGRRGGWAVGTIVIIIGVVFLGKNAGWFGTDWGFHNWWALFILIPTFGSFAGAWRAYSPRKPVGRRRRPRFHDRASSSGGDDHLLARTRLGQSLAGAAGDRGYRVCCWVGDEN